MVSISGWNLNAFVSRALNPKLPDIDSPVLICAVMKARPPSNPLDGKRADLCALVRPTRPPCCRRSARRPCDSLGKRHSVLNWIVAGSRICQSGRCAAGTAPPVAASLTASVARFLAEAPPGSGRRCRGLVDWHGRVWLWRGVKSDWAGRAGKLSQTLAQTHTIAHHSNSPDECECLKQPPKWTFQINSQGGRQNEKKERDLEFKM